MEGVTAPLPYLAQAAATKTSRAPHNDNTHVRTTGVSISSQDLLASLGSTSVVVMDSGQEVRLSRLIRHRRIITRFPCAAILHDRPSKMAVGPCGIREFADSQHTISQIAIKSRITTAHRSNGARARCTASSGAGGGSQQATDDGLLPAPPQERWPYCRDGLLVLLSVSMPVRLPGRQHAGRLKAPSLRLGSKCCGSSPCLPAVIAGAGVACTRSMSCVPPQT